MENNNQPVHRPFPMSVGNAAAATGQGRAGQCHSMNACGSQVSVA